MRGERKNFTPRDEAQKAQRDLKLDDLQEKAELARKLNGQDSEERPEQKDPEEPN